MALTQPHSAKRWVQVSGSLFCYVKEKKNKKLQLSVITVTGIVISWVNSVDICLKLKIFYMK